MAKAIGAKRKRKSKNVNMSINQVANGFTVNNWSNDSCKDETHICTTKEEVSQRVNKLLGVK